MTSSDPGVGRLSWLRAGNWSLPVKLTVVLAVPIILAMTLGVLRVSDQIHKATELGARDRYIVLQDRVSTFIGQLERERDQSAVFVAGNRTGDRSMLKSAFGAVDGGLADTEAAIGNPATLGGGPEAAYRQVKDNLWRLVNLRDQVTGVGVDASVVVARYTGLIEPLLVFQAALDQQLNTAQLVGMAAGLTALSSAREQLALEHAVIAVAISRGVMSTADADTVRAAEARLGTAIEQFRAGLDANQQQRLAGWIGNPADTQRQRLRQTALSRVGTPGQLGISQNEWDGAYQGVLDQLRVSESGLRDEIKATSVALQEKARDGAGVNSVILLLGLLATAAVLYLIGRSLLKPLRVLRRSALDVADRQLPEALAAMREGKTPDTTIEPVPVTTREEIGQVARAFDAVHGQAVRLAAEQAILQAGVNSMFVNLSRRSQGLVERQLKLIEELERNEQDSEQLANLFQLDHLATRMRRNSENLLVLAGSDLAKRANQVVPVVDVLRAAVSEIEQYQRVVVQTPPDVQVVGRAASDLVHLVAELLDNATAFSAPDTQVVVSSTQTPDGSVLVEIADQGVGMPGEELISANNRLSGPAEVNVSVSRRMGLFVVGRLASRHGIGVRLASSDPGRGASSGVTASVNVPNYLISGALTDSQALEAIRSARSESVEQAAAGLNGASPFVAEPAAANGSALSVSGPAAPDTAASGALPRRAAGASLTGRLELPDPPSAPPTRRMSPPQPGFGGAPRGPLGESNARPVLPHRGTLRSPDGLRSLRMPPPPPAAPPPSAPQPPASPPRVPEPPAGGPEKPVAAQRPLRRSEQHALEKQRRDEQQRLAEEQRRSAERRQGADREPAAGRHSEETVSRSQPVPPVSPVERSQPVPPVPPVSPVERSQAVPPVPPVPPVSPVERSQAVSPVEHSQAVSARDGLSAAPPADKGKDADGAAPIFEEMASAWFRDNWEVTSREEARLVPAPEVPAPPLPPGPPGGWGDSDGWNSGEPLLRPFAETPPSELTSAGLPQRRRGSRLIPNASSQSSAEDAAGHAAPTRTPEQVRGRLASYQQGVREGRRRRLETDPAKTRTGGDTFGEET